MMRRSGFTLVELLIVIIIVAILATIAIPKFSDSSLRSKEASLRRNLSILREAGNRCTADTGLTVEIPDLTSATPPTHGWKPTQMGLDWAHVALDPKTWHGPYLGEVPINPITGSNRYVTGGQDYTASWTHYTKQTFNKSYYFFPSNLIASDGTLYKTW